MSHDDRYLTIAVTRRTLARVAEALSFASLAGFAFVAIHELSYAGTHPHAYGPAKIIATAAGAGVLLSLALALVALAVLSEPGGRAN